MSNFSCILITGANGQLGKALTSVFANHNSQIHAVDRSWFDLTNPVQMKALLSKHKPDLIINTAAYTAVDKAEEEPGLAQAVNATALDYLCDYAEPSNATIMHLSTDYVFGGRGNVPYKPNDPVNCQNTYAKTKWQGEEILRNRHKRHVIIRTSWLYGNAGSNFLNTMLRLATTHKQLKVVYDQIGTPTYVDDLADAIFQIVHKLTPDDARYGTYHYSNHGVASWYDFATAIFEIEGLNTKVQPVRSHEFPTKALRPSFSVLDKSDTEKQFQLQIPHWRESLRNCIAKK